MKKSKFVAVALVFLSVVLFSGCIQTNAGGDHTPVLHYPDAPTFETIILTSSDGTNTTEVEYYKNGKIKYKRDLFILDYRFNSKFGHKFPNGKYLSWFESGEVESVGNFRYSVETATTTGTIYYYYKDGNVSKENKFLNSLKQGVWSEFFEDGSIKSKVNYHSGDLNGTYLTYHNPAQIHKQGTYLNGEKQGLWTQWFPNGQLEYTAIYGGGVPVRNIEWYSETGEKIF